MKEVIRLDNIRRDFVVGDEVVHALRGISLTITEGEFVTIMGTSGSGKSTLLNTLGCLDTPTSGEYYLDGIAVRSMDKNARATLRNRKIGFVFQNFNLVPVLSALENVMLPLQIKGVDEGSARARATTALIDVGLERFKNSLPDKLSGGQRQRVAIARALVVDPKLVIADEPTANLDSENSRMIIDLMREMNQARKVTFVFTTHDQRLLDHVDRKIQLRDGNIASDEVMA